LQVPIWWNLIESREDSFSFTEVEKILELANKYNLKIELLWFSTYMCGDSFSYLVPTYILAKPDKRLYRNDEGSFWDYYGYQYSLILDDNWILERESNVVKKLMDDIGEWDLAHGKQHPVISVQVHNEPDCFARWRFDQKKIAYKDGRPFTKSDAWKMTLNALNAIGNAIKSSNYVVVTRVNLVTTNGLNNFPEVPTANPIDVFNLEGIDFISYDPYVNSINTIKTNTLAFRSLINNYPLIAENKGTYENTASLILSAVALGSGYNIYDLSTSKFFIDHTTDPANIDHGIYTYDLKEKSYTESVHMILKGLVAAYPDVAKTKSEDFAAFNVKTQTPAIQCVENINTSKIAIKFSTVNGALAFCIAMDNYALIYATNNSEFDLSNANFSNAVKGHYFSDGTFIVDGNVDLSNGHIFDAEPGVLYRIDFTTTNTLSSNTEDAIGSI
jgi:hypothetical protein